jgi:hypothetical protein
MMPMRKLGFLFFLVALAGLMLACNLARQVPITSLPPSPTPGGVRVTPQILPSITPLFGAQGATPVVGSQLSVTLGVTLPPRVSTPGTVTVTIPAGQIGDFLSYVFNNIILPILNIGVNMIGSSATYLWQLAGAQGGWIGQVGCCIVPVLVLIAIVLRGGRRRRGWFDIF